jgi:4-hydroxybenzoate polyprenyltransferase
MEKKQILLNYFRLIRPQGAVSTAVVIIIGYLIMMGSHNLINLFILFIIGVLGHIFGFVLNEYIDIRIDEKSRYLKEKPLVSGAITKNHALFIALVSCVCAYILTIIFFWSLFPLIFLSLAFLSGIIYDTLGKKILGSDVFIGGSAFFGCLFGASIVSIHFTNLVYIISLSTFIFIVFCNAVVGGLKDADHDSLAGAKTTATRMGVKVENGKMLITKKFKVFAYALDLAFIILIILAVFQPEISLWQSDQYIILIIMIILMFIVLATLYKFLNLPNFERPRLYRLFLLNGTASYLLVPLVILPIIGLNFMLVLLVLPTAWLLICNLILYGKPVQPQL